MSAEIAGLPEVQDFEPTMTRPLPSFDCTKIIKDRETGEERPCGRKGIMGMPPEIAKCSSHGGSLASVREKAAARVETAQMRIAHNADHAAEVLVSLTETGTADNIRLKAATEILDRAGIRAGVEINMSGEVTVNHADEVRERLAKLALGKLDLMPDPDEEDIEDAEIVDE